MNFWKNVDLELDYLGKTRKELATAAGFDVSTIAKGLKTGSVPAADTALKIAKFLRVSLEFLLTGNEGKIAQEEASSYALFKEYRPVLLALDSLPIKVRSLLSTMILTLAEK